MAALMLTLVLSGVGVVVMQSTMMSMKLSGNYKMRKQASAAAEAAVLYTSNMVGDQAGTFWRAMESSTQVSMSQNAAGMGSFGARQDAVRRGGAMIVTNSPPAANPLVPTMGVMQSAGAIGETGLFSSSSGAAKSFEQKNGVGGTAANTFRVVLRDPIEGPPAPGYSGRFCFKKIYFASEARYGTTGTGTEVADWTSPPSTIATGRNGMEGFIGPIECGAR
jgi:Tfp pilus assembly protein PilX